MLAADELDHDVDGRVAHDVVPVGGEGVVGDAAGAGRLGVERAGAGDAQVDAIAGKILVVVAQDEAGDAAAHGAQADDANVHGAHVLSFA